MGANTGVRSPVQRLPTWRQAVEGLRAELRDPQAAALTIAALTAVTFVMVRLVGGAPSAFMELGFVPVGLAAFAFGARGGLVTGLAVAAVLGPLPSLLGFDRVEGPFEWLIRLAAFGGVGLVLGAALDAAGARAAFGVAQPRDAGRIDAASPGPQVRDAHVEAAARPSAWDHDDDHPLEWDDARPLESALARVSPAGTGAAVEVRAAVAAAEAVAAPEAVSAPEAVTFPEAISAPEAVTFPEAVARAGDSLHDLALAAESRDMDAHGHLARLELLSRRLAAQHGLQEAVAAEIGRSAVFHDIGKLRVPDRILLKPEPLNPDEWATVRMHTFWSEEALEGEQLAVARQIARSHHENWDGTGYPDGLYGDRIPLPARIVRIVDAFDAMTNDRPYQLAVSFEAAMEELRAGAGSDYDPELVGRFVELIRSDAALRAQLTTQGRP